MLGLEKVRLYAAPGTYNRFNGLGAGALVWPLLGNGHAKFDALARLYGEEMASVTCTMARERFELVGDAAKADWAVIEPGPGERGPRWAGERPRRLIFRPEDAGHLEDPDEEPGDLEIRRSVDPADPRWARGDRVVQPAFPHRDWPGNEMGLEPRPLPANGPVRVGFCGQTRHREDWIEALRRVEPPLQPDVVTRLAFTPRSSAFPLLREQYWEHLNGCHYILCPPGAGRYTYRFYETLSAGRIPILTPDAGREAWFPATPRRAYVRMAPGETINEAVERHLSGIGGTKGLRNAKDLAQLARIAWEAFLSPAGWLLPLYTVLRGGVK